MHCGNSYLYRMAVVPVGRIYYICCCVWTCTHVLCELGQVLCTLWANQPLEHSACASARAGEDTPSCQASHVDSATGCATWQGSMHECGQLWRALLCHNDRGFMCMAASHAQSIMWLAEFHACECTRLLQDVSWACGFVSSLALLTGLHISSKHVRPAQIKSPSRAWSDRGTTSEVPRCK